MTAAVAGYSFQAEAQPLMDRGGAFMGPPRPQNIMFDRRVVRGPAFSAIRVVPSDPNVPETTQRKPRRRSGRQKKSKYPDIYKPDVEPMQGRLHIEVQTDTYLEEIADRPKESDINTQTEAELDRPPTPLFIPKKTGIEVSTEILDGDLFYFDKEVEPILEKLVGQIMDQSLMEVVRDQELHDLRAYREEFRNVRRTELAATRRLEEEERSRNEEKQQRIHQERERLKREAEMKEKLAQKKFAQEFMGTVATDTLSNLQRKGYFGDPLMREVEVQFMPWLLSEANSRIVDLQTARGLVDDLIHDALRKAATARIFAQREAVERVQMAKHDRIEVLAPTPSLKKSPDEERDPSEDSASSSDYESSGEN
eukprot:gnl/Hemi2/25161_TR8463_c0_g1_i1.p2 gnl/Hemi2/25161_TR8463_c0_g1~~gnl/Hemi2/25161_TR8463_c0_g1_i1.p2  ORF type:complete len:367 (+),score=119.76 gnl/Hemi2/25161_TR8463_c0_g1_i1:133-1233(+)